METDIVVVGAGAAGLLAAVAARGLGHRVIVVEGSNQVGGATAGDDGLLWLPGHHVSDKRGPRSERADAGAYLDHVLGQRTAASSAARRSAFLRTAPHLARWLTSSRLPLAVVKGLPDHDPAAPGAAAQGRVVASQPMDLRVLGEWQQRLRRPRGDAGDGLLSGLGRVLRRARPSATGGQALVAQLLHRATANGVDVLLEAPLVDLVADGDSIAGVVIRRDGTDVEIHAARGVILTAGGFEGNQELREEYLPLPTDTHWSVGIGNRGEALQAALAHGAATAALDEAWWVPVLVADGVAHPVDRALSLPHAVLVDQAGARFVNESAPPVTVGRALYDRSRGVRSVPAYLVVDARHRQVVPLGPWPAGSIPRKALDAKDAVRASTLNDLAQALGIDRAGLLGTVVRFNGFAAKGRDGDFRRGTSAWDKAVGDPSKRRNPCLGKVDKPPFWAVKVYPGDHGTKGGLLVDENARVLRRDGSPVVGLYAVSGTAASMMRATSPAPGAALASALVEAFRAVLAISDQLAPIDGPTQP